MIRIGILGASGYTGQRLAYYLSRHSEAEIVFATSRKDAGKKMSDLYGSLGGVCDIKLVDPDDAASMEIDVLFTCAPDQTSMKIVPGYYDRGVKIVDLAGDYRMDTAESYERWYGAPHESPEYIGKAVYGLTELNRGAVGNARLVSNPGCYPTSVILGLAPLLGEGLVESSSVHVNAVSGISGAGRGLSTYKLFYETDSNVLPYKFGRSHKHVGEIEQEISKLAGEPCIVSFAPHVIPVKTGILSTIVVGLKRACTKDDLTEIYRAAYDGEFFVRFHPGRLPESKFVADTNFCDIGVTLLDGGERAIVVSTICNLGKGASGQAVQNMNVMCGFDEREGLL